MYAAVVIYVGMQFLQLTTCMSAFILFYVVRVSTTSMEKEIMLVFVYWRRLYIISILHISFAFAIKDNRQLLLVVQLLSTFCRITKWTLDGL